MSYAAYMRAVESRLKAANKLTVRQIIKIAVVFSFIVRFVKWRLISFISKYLNLIYVVLKHFISRMRKILFRLLQRTNTNLGTKGVYLYCCWEAAYPCDTSYPCDTYERLNDDDDAYVRTKLSIQAAPQGWTPCFPGFQLLLHGADHWCNSRTTT